MIVILVLAAWIQKLKAEIEYWKSIRTKFK